MAFMVDDGAKADDATGGATPDDTDTPPDTPPDTPDDTPAGPDATQGDDRLDADGAETLQARGGNDTIQAQDQSTAYGGAGNDSFDVRDDATAFGEAGNDKLNTVDRSGAFGGDGNDTFDATDGSAGYGGDGNDTIVGFTETTLTGGAGRDLFVARTFGEERPYVYDRTTPEQFDLAYVQDETITITDFTKGPDALQIDLDGAVPTQVDLADDGTDTTVTLSFANSAGDPFTSSVVLKQVTGLTLDDLAFSNGAKVETVSNDGKYIMALNPGTPATV